MTLVQNLSNGLEEKGDLICICLIMYVCSLLDQSPMLLGSCERMRELVGMLKPLITSLNLFEMMTWLCFIHM